MGYSGYEEILCARGHHSELGEDDAIPEVCPHRDCNARVTRRHSVNTTNGYNRSYPSTCGAPKREIGFDDEWHQDHYGNKYAVKVPRYSSKSRVWINIAAERKRRDEEERLNQENRRWTVTNIDTLKNIWEFLNEYDEVTKTFKFVADVDDVNMVHQFKERVEAERALQVIIAENKRVAVETGTEAMRNPEICCIDLRSFGG